MAIFDNLNGGNTVPTESVTPKAEAESTSAKATYERKEWSAKSDIEEMEARERFLDNATTLHTAERAEVFPEEEEVNRERAKLQAKVKDGSLTMEQAQKEYDVVTEKYSDYFDRMEQVNEELHDLRLAIINAKDRHRKEAEAAAKDEAKKQLEAKYNGYLKGKAPFIAANTYKALGKRVDFGEEGTMTVAEFVEKHHAAGDLSYEKKMFAPAHPKRWNAMTGYEQDVWEKTHQPKEECVVNGRLLGKTAYDYAQWLSEKQPAKAEAKAPGSKKDAPKQEKPKKNVDEPIEDVGEKIGGAPLTHEEQVLRDALDEVMQKNGLDVIGSEAGQRVLDEANGEVKLEAKRKRALETVSVSRDEEHQQTVISSADGAKVLNNLDTLVKDYENSSHTKEKTFIGTVAKALGAERDGSKSEYATFETKNGKIVTIRLADHNAKVSTFDNHGELDGISIVVSPKANEGTTNDGNAHVTEFFYDAIKLRRAEGKPLAEIVKSIKQALYSGEFKDTTGLAERQEVNTDKVREHRVYHGSGADFDAFDHSHMGEGEGAQAYGWGTYVTEVEGIGRTYAEAAHTKMYGLRKEELKSNIYRAKERLPFMREGEYKTELERQIAEWENEYSKLFGTRMLYTVDIPDDNGKNYLDWNGVISSDTLDRITDRLRNEVGDEVVEGKWFSNPQIGSNAAAKTLRGMTVYHQLERVLGSDKKASEFLSSLGFAGIKYPAENGSGGRKDGAKNYVIFNEADAKITDKVRFFRTKDGEAYGFTIGGKIYYDPRIATSETLVHEYAHLWASALRAANPKEWKNVVALMKGTSVWNEVKKLYPELKTDDAIADEVIAQYSGRRGAERLRAEARKIAEGNGSVFEKAEAISALERVKQALQKFWKGVCDFLHIHYTSAEEVADRVMKDLLDGVDPRKFGKTDGKVRMQFVGEKGAEAADHAEEVTTRLDNLAVAREMEEAKKDAKTIKMATGWERGADGKWRYEIGDAKFKLKRKDYSGIGTYDLNEVLDSKELFDAYPSLKKCKVEFRPQRYMHGNLGETYTSENRIHVSNAQTVKEITSTLLHEVQHMIQHKEGFARGGSEEETVYTKGWKRRVSRLEKEIKTLDLELSELESEGSAAPGGIPDLPKEKQDRIDELRKKIHELYRKRRHLNEELEPLGYEKYTRLAGEVESRNVESRMGMTPEQQRASLASETEDVAREDQIFLFGEGGESHMGTRTNKHMAEIGAHYEGKTLTDEERAVVDVYSGTKDRETVILTNKDGSSIQLEMQQGNEPNAGTRHSIFRHVGKNNGSISYDEIILIPDIVKTGERTDKGANVIYQKKIDGVRYIVYTDKKSNKELFHDFYSNRKTAVSKSLSGESTNTQSSARTSDNAVSAANVGRKSETASKNTEKDADAGMKFRLLDEADPKARELEALPESELVPVYRNVQAFEDDALGSPMAFTDAVTGERRTLEGRRWNYSVPPEIKLTDEQQRQLDELNKNGYIMVDGKKVTELKLNDALKFVKPKKGDAKLQYFLKKNTEDSGLWADYNPYDHAVETPLNTQFASAYKRPNLVVVRCLIPKSEIDEPYHADYAAKATGAHLWNNGRTLYLSRWSKIDKVLRDALDEVMQKNGLDVIGSEAGQRALDEANGEVKLEAKRKRALETVSVSRDEEHQQTVISSADGAKVLNNSSFGFTLREPKRAEGPAIT